MNNLTPQLCIANTAAVLDGPYGSVTRQAKQSGTSRQALYRDAHHVLRAVDGSYAQQRLDDLQHQLDQIRNQRDDLQRQLQQTFVCDQDRIACFAATAQAEGVSLPVTRALLQILLGQRTPSVAQLGRWTHAAAQHAAELLPVLDAVARTRAEQVAADEIFFARQPCLMVVEQYSLCWLTGRLADNRDGDTWAEEFRSLPNLQQVTRDGGQGLAKGVALVNQERQDRPVIADQEDHFHTLREGGRALRRTQQSVCRLIDAAAEAQRREQRKARRTGRRQGTAAVRAQADRRAEAAVDAAVAVERAWGSVVEALRLFTSTGMLNSRVQAEGIIAAAMPTLSGEEWAKTRRALSRPQLLTFLDQTHERLAALPVSSELRDAAVEAEGLRQRLARDGSGCPSSAGIRGLLLATSLVVSLSGRAGVEAVNQVRGVLRQAWRASSLVEGLNSVTRMHQSRHRRMTGGLLSLKRLYWNCREFRTGRRRRKTPYGLLGVPIPRGDWWELLRLTPEQLRQQLSAPAVAA